jgi:hypothetical protein
MEESRSKTHTHRCFLGLMAVRVGMFMLCKINKNKLIKQHQQRKRKNQQNAANAERMKMCALNNLPS